MDMCNVNIDGQKALTQTLNMGRSTKLADDKRWLDAINEAQRHESDFHEYQRKMRVADLRQTYLEQAEEKRERERSFVKF